jgi:protein involved in polysaccharide export with SLBB domain
MKRAIASMICVLVLVSAVFAQAGAASTAARTLSADTPRATTGTLSAADAQRAEGAETEQPSPEGRVALAMTSPEYPVTPGDTYTLTFVTSTGLNEVTVVVNVDCSIQLANIGVIKAEGMRFIDLKALIERRVLEAYPLSSPQLVIRSCGLFPVYVRGEVPKSSIVYQWGLARLSDLWQGVTPYASYRSIAVRSAGGHEKIYDLFKAWRTGDMAQDPLLRPGDTVTFSKYTRSVTVSGEVRRPGTYQLTDSDSLQDVIEEYCDGFSPQADASRITLKRSVRGMDPVGEARVLAYAESKDFALEDMDVLSVPSVLEAQPVVYIEGALRADAEGALESEPAVRLPYVFYPGETLGQALRSIKSKLSPLADLSTAYFVRNGAARSVDLVKFIYGNDFSSDFALEPNDVVYIPFQKLYVYVGGAVKLPGEYPYAPDRTWDYYIGLAGGFDESKNSSEKLTIQDVRGRKYGKERIIEPEDRIIAAENDVLYNLGRAATIASTIISAVALIVSIMQ